MEFDVRRNMEAYRKLTSIFQNLNANDTFTNYLFNTKVSSQILYFENKVYSDLNLMPFLKLDNYFELLVSIAIRQIVQIQHKENKSNKVCLIKKYNFTIYYLLATPKGK